MSSLSKINLEGTILNLTLPADGTLNSDDFTSLDSESVNAWTGVTKISELDNHATIFSKITSMVKNIRYLYSRLGNISQYTIADSIAEKADISHSHTVDDLPISSVQIDSNQNIPTSGLIYQMDNQINDLDSRVTVLEQCMFISDPNGYSDLISGLIMTNFTLIYNNQGIAIVNMSLSNPSADLRKNNPILYLTHTPAASTTCTVTYNNNQTASANVGTDGSIVLLNDIKKSNNPISISFMYAI